MDSIARINNGIRRTLSILTAAVATAGLLAIVDGGNICAQTTSSATALGSLGMSAGASGASAASEQPSQAESLAPGPSYCSPCLYYSGDMDPSDPNENALSNENDLIVSPSQVFTPFSVPNGHVWMITGVLINTDPESGTVHLPKKAGWSIWRGTSTGVAGTLLAAGANKAMFTPTGRTLVGLLSEYTALVTLPQPVALGAGTYFLNVVPQCTDPTSCSGQRFFESNVTDVLPVHHHGPANIVGGSFWNSAFFSSNYGDPNGQGDFNLFSFGIVGTCTTTGGLACPF
jgi:hypothetical protein